MTIARASSSAAASTGGNLRITPGEGHSGPRRFGQGIECGLEIALCVLVFRREHVRRPPLCPPEAVKDVVLVVLQSPLEPAPEPGDNRVHQLGPPEQAPGVDGDPRRLAVGPRLRFVASPPAVTRAPPSGSRRSSRA